MSKYFNHFLLKILLLSTFLVLCFNIGDNLINANKVSQEVEKKSAKVENNQNFKVIGKSSLGKTGVAITTNLGIRFKQRKELPATIYKDIFSVSEVITNKELANKELIGTNMMIVEEYKNVLQTDIKQLLDSSYDKPRILNAFIEQLEYRYTIGSENIKKLSEQKAILIGNMEGANSQIETLKQKIERDFANNDSEESLENINKYLDLKQEYYYARTYVVYINHFLSEYNYLNQYNKKLLDTLINNKDAIVKNAYVVIPDSGSNLLKKFDLIYTEEEYKK